MHALVKPSLLAAVAVLFAAPARAQNPPPLPGLGEPGDVLLPNERLKIPFRDDVPILFVTRNQPEWATLKSFWNDSTQQTVDPATGAQVSRAAVKIKLPLGLTTAPSVPTENPMTLAKWTLGKKLYFDPLLSSNGEVSCASCHSPAKGFTDQRRVSTGIGRKLGGINSPTIVNSAYNRFQFWDGRAGSLEEQAQGPVGNNLEMFAGKHDPWDEAVFRCRKNPDYVKAFTLVFGHAPTRDAAAKAIATYERTVLVGNSIHDRAEAIMRKRVTEEETGKFEVKAEDYAAALKDAFAAKDTGSLAALLLDPQTDAAKAGEIGAKLFSGRNLFFGKARCSNCHTGETFTDHGFHNLGVGAAKDGTIPPGEFGRFARLATGHKDATFVGAFKTPGLRSLLATAPYMHSGDEKTLEAVVDFYDRGGNANPYLSEKMRDTKAEAEYNAAAARGEKTDPAVQTFGPAKLPIVPFKLNLTAQEKADLVLFLRALNGDPVDAAVADSQAFPNVNRPTP